jgi:chemotaxis family two-component system response regulator Rcp1
MPERAPSDGVIKDPLGARVLRILVIDDNAPDVMLIDESVRAQGLNFEMTHLSDGEDALAKLAAAPEELAAYDLIILDLNMPRVGGFEVLAQVRDNGSLNRVPILVLTSSLAPKEQDEARRLGADRYLDKPADLDEFLKAVGTAVRELVGNGN